MIIIEEILAANGITTSWVLVAVALTFVQMQSYAKNLYMDELSGLYNRRYLNLVFAEIENTNRRPLHGIMMDINDFKCINDNWGIVWETMQKAF